jgi:hypothetical protein
MANNPSLTCNFTLQSNLNLGVSFQSDNGGMNYGGEITISTPATSGPISTGLWDSDGNVFFTIYTISGSSPVGTSCTINSGSVPGSFTPYVVVASEAGLSCVISAPQRVSENVYNYTLTITASAPTGRRAKGGSAQTDAQRARVAAPARQAGSQRESANDAPIYTFAVSLLDAGYPPNGGLQIWQSGTLTLVTTSAPAVSGTLSLPGFYAEQLLFEGTTSEVAGGTLVNATGKSSEAQITFSFVYNFDGFLYSGSYLGGTANMLDFSAQETYLYVIQGLSPQGPFGEKRLKAAKS